MSKKELAVVPLTEAQADAIRDIYGEKKGADSGKWNADNWPDVEDDELGWMLLKIVHSDHWRAFRESRRRHEDDSESFVERYGD